MNSLAFTGSGAGEDAGAPDRGPCEDHQNKRCGRNLAHHAGISGPGFLMYLLVIASADQYASAPKGPVGL